MESVKSMQRKSVSFSAQSKFVFLIYSDRYQTSRSFINLFSFIFLDLLHDPHSECLRWLEMCDIDKTVYSQAPVSFMSQNNNSDNISERSGFYSVNIGDEILKILQSAGITSFEFSKLPDILCSNGLFDVISKDKEKVIGQKL